MGCRLTHAGKEVAEGVIVVTTSLIAILILVFIAGWVQLNVFGLNIIPDADVHSPAEYYMLTGGMFLGSTLIGVLFALVMYLNITGDGRLPKLFTCKEESK
jgi:hypothetical protein